jgi:hypothetical protein
LVVIRFLRGYFVRPSARPTCWHSWVSA